MTEINLIVLIFYDPYLLLVFTPSHLKSRQSKLIFVGDCINRQKNITLLLNTICVRSILLLLLGITPLGDGTAQVNCDCSMPGYIVVYLVEARDNKPLLQMEEHFPFNQFIQFRLDKVYLERTSLLSMLKRTFKRKVNQKHEIIKYCSIKFVLHSIPQYRVADPGGVDPDPDTTE